ncbi:PIG-L family deacetylase [Paenibacillus sp. KS-LC4]|uniref:PIG-L deacetylase family protein n=1 Tax=Paenibacillus sp. KS-LC4 TaxID=2979727 RepID=UPI0030D056FD
MSWLNADKFIFVSPHYDDVVLSCAATIMKLLDRKYACTVNTVYGGGPADSYVPSQVAIDYVVEDLGLTCESVSIGHCLELLSIRRAEDARAMERIGISCVKTMDIPDAIYRESEGSCFYATEDELFGAPHVEDEANVCAEFLKYVQTTDQNYAYRWVFPAISNHVDHRILIKVGKQLAAAGYCVLFYAEVPYWKEDQPFSERDWIRINIHVKELAQLKAMAIMEYRSQLLGLFNVNETDEIQNSMLNDGIEVFWVRKTDTELIRLFHSL